MECHKQHFEFVIVVQMRKIYKPRMLLKIYFGIKFTVEINAFDVRLVNFKSFMISISEKYSDSFTTSHRSKYLIIVEYFDLIKSFCYQSRFVIVQSFDMRREKSPKFIFVKVC